ncbi:MAG: hypothetical protein KF746_06955 [Chitinophagaceae bacterium]|nr:hypothetical protein [Chitinophagaceae bacterium]
MILKAAQKCKRGVAFLLLFSFLNVMTFLPGSYLADTDNVETLHFAGSWTGEDEEMNRSTVIELILENIAGLKDCLPNSEKPDFSYHYFSVKFRSIGSFFSELITEPPMPEIRQPLLAVHTFASTGKERLPRLQHHNFVFRLTPF